MFRGLLKYFLLCCFLLNTSQVENYLWAQDTYFVQNHVRLSRFLLLNLSQTEETDFIPLSLSGNHISRNYFRGYTFLNGDISSGKPPLKVENMAREIFSGGACGFLGGILGVGTGVFVETKIFGSSGEFAGFGGLIIGGGLGIILGSTMGVCMIGNSREERGSFLVTLLGSFVGFLATSNNIAERGPALLFLGTPIGGTIGFNLTRRYRRMPGLKTAFINIEKGGMSIGSFGPSLFLVQNTSGVLVQKIGIVRLAEALSLLNWDV